MKSTIDKYHYKECGLKNVFIEGLSITDDDDDNLVMIPNVQELHYLIAKDILKSEYRLDSDQIRFLRSEMGMNQSELAEIMGRTSQTIHNWERQTPTMDTITEAYFRILAMKRLKVSINEDPAKVKTWCTKRAKRKASIKIRLEKRKYSNKPYEYNRNPDH